MLVNLDLLGVKWVVICVASKWVNADRGACEAGSTAGLWEKRGGPRIKTGKMELTPGDQESDGAGTWTRKPQSLKISWVNRDSKGQVAGRAWSKIPRGWQDNLARSGYLSRFYILQVWRWLGWMSRSRCVMTAGVQVETTSCSSSKSNTGEEHTQDGHTCEGKRTLTGDSTGTNTGILTI